MVKQRAVDEDARLRYERVSEATKRGLRWTRWFPHTFWSTYNPLFFMIFTSLLPFVAFVVIYRSMY